MAATALSSPFSTSVHSLKSVKSKIWPNNYHLLKISCPKTLQFDDHLLKISCPKTLQFASLSHSIGTELSSASNKWRVVRVTAVAQEEEAAVEEDVVDAESGGPNTKLYFGNLPYNCDSAQLAGIIQEYASPELVEVLYDRNTGKSRGFAFVTMSSIEECNTVIQNLDAREYGGRTLRVNFSDKPKPKEPLYPETEHKLFVGNLSWTVTSEMLTQAFQQYGNIVGARVLYDGETGKSRGYGFVSYETKEEMESALQALDGVEIEGRAIRVSLAQGKKQ